MIETLCNCGRTVQADVSAVGAAVSCKTCGKHVRIASSEAVTDDAALGDFDARLVFLAGPDSVGDSVALGGASDLTIGKLDDRKIILPGTMVSRTHAKLVRLDFGPSRWKILDTNSRNGVVVNGVKTTEAELRDGDTVQIGDYKLRFAVGFPAVAAEPVPPGSGITCTSCGVTYPANTQICITCGLDLKTRRPLVTSKHLDEDEVAMRARTWLRVVSWFMPLGISPVASEAFGTQKPRATWAITGITVAISAFVYLGTIGNGGRTPPELINWKLWVGDRQAEVKRLEAIQHDPDAVLQRFLERIRARGGTIPESTDYDKLRDEIRQAAAQQEQDLGEFHWYQLLTNAFLHAGIIHLAGNLVFLLVFGLRVNELIGNWKMAILYPVLAVCASGAYAIAEWRGPLRPAIGASGAIMGLAGMYFIFFPVQRVHMAVWFRGGLLTGWRMLFKTFRMSGFWLLVLWIAFNDGLPTVLHAFGLDQSDHVAHAAHLGGFVSGAIIALGLLFARQVDARGADILSVTLGPKAWALIGKPADRSEASPPIEVTRYPV